MALRQSLDLNEPMTQQQTGHALARLQAARLPLAMLRAEEKLAHASRDASPNQLIRASQRARTVEQRIVWLQRAADAWSRPLEGIAACRKGCSHCCQIPVTISRTEANLIGRFINRKPTDPAISIRLASIETESDLLAAEASLQADTTLAPCPFLLNDACSIYAHRPMVCRTLINLDDDNLLCLHSGQGPASVPYADARMLKVLLLAAQPTGELADIRQFFPDAGAPLSNAHRLREAMQTV